MKLQYQAHLPHKQKTFLLLVHEFQLLLINIITTLSLWNSLSHKKTLLNANIGIALLKDNIKAGKDTKALEISQFEGFPQSELLIEDNQTIKNPPILKAFQKSNSCLDSPNQDDSILHQPSVKEGFGKPPKVTIVALPTAKDLVFINDVPEVNPITCPLSQDESTQPLLSPGTSASNKTAKVLPRISDPRTNISANLPHHEAPISGLSTLQAEDFSTSSPHVITHQHQHHAQSDEQSQSKGDTVGVGENGQQGQTTVGSNIVLSKKVQCSLPETKPPPSCSTSECPSSSSQDVSGKKVCFTTQIFPVIFLKSDFFFASVLSKAKSQFINKQGGYCK
ncbi:hypothetical protein PPACK8108_LOCUS5416 [Phakopsora pachyrhizi]|uniref:Uncharacterized protein n=1 Tax=Phakopsora pachyrhizi TaxID=170000 RepID=A0AAV0AS90_PHAPC|nr:hypothetical protein PPACK8108_LOCUS5416 [Phakopsora pachyrhizi]